MYNEKAGSQLLYASRIREEKEITDLTVRDKIQAFAFNLSKNVRTEKVTFHVSLNPDPSDKLTDGQLRDIAVEYMERMKYGKQPYLVYKHTDIDRTHIHIVSVRVDSAGKKIDGNFEKKRSDEIRKDLEIKYGLKQTGTGKSERVGEELPKIEKIIYGIDETKRGIADVVLKVVRDYKFTGISEYRALLRQFNVTVEEVKDEKTASKKVGLIYITLNEAGKKTGKIIKSSEINKSAGLEALKQKFECDKAYKNDSTIVTSVTKRIDAVLKKEKNSNRASFKAGLEKTGVIPSYLVNEQNRLYGIHFIDNESKTVWSGRELGKEYSAHILNEKLPDSIVQSGITEKTKERKILILEKPEKDVFNKEKDKYADAPEIQISNLPKTVADMVQTIFETETSTDTRQEDIKRKKRKKKIS